MTRARILANYVAGGTTAAEFDYLDGVTSNVQTQMNAKAPLASPAFTGTPTGITAAHLEAGVLPSDVTGGSGLTALGTVTSGSIGSGVTGLTGVKNCDTWRITSNFTVPGLGDNILTANWERDDTGMMSQTIGTGMTESSGVFAFPSTGLWLVMVNGFVNLGSTGNYAGIIPKFTRDNGSDSYNKSLLETYTHVASNTHISSFAGQGILDVTDISNVKIKFNFHVHSSGSSTTLGGNSNLNASCVTFIRIGDT